MAARRARRDVDTDPLTGLRNRRPFDLWLTGGRVADWQPGALLLVDVDDFKLVNDGHGHDRGDEVLRAVAATLAAAAGPGSLAVRLGGDEFAVLLDGDGLTPELARERAARARAAIACAPWEAIADGLRVTASIGVAVGVPAVEGTSHPADPVAMYRAATPRFTPGRPAQDSRWPTSRLHRCSRSLAWPVTAVSSSCASGDEPPVFRSA